MPPSRKQRKVCFLGKPSPVVRKTMIRFIKNFRNFRTKAEKVGGSLEEIKK